MSNYSRLSHSLGDQRAGQSVHCYQSVWMARLTQTSGSASSLGQNGLSLSLIGNGDGDAKKFTEITDMRTIRIMNERVAITERLDCQPFPLFDVCQNTGTKIGLDNFPHGHASRPQFDFKTENNGIRTIKKFSSLLEMGPHGSGSREHVFEKVSQCLEEPAIQMIPLRSNKEKAPEVSFLCRSEKFKPLTLGSPSIEYLSNASMIGTKREHNHDLGNLSIMGHDKNCDDHSTSGKFGTSFSKPCNASFAGEPSKKMQNLPRTELFPNRTTSVKEVAQSVNLSHEGCTFRKLPGSMLDLEAMEIFNAKSLDGIAGGQNTFSQMTHNLQYTENLNNNKQKPLIKESCDSMNSNRNMFTQLLSLSPPTGLGQRGVKIQLLDSSSDSQGKQDVKGILNIGVCQKNESSAETSTMDMDTFKQQNNFYGVNSSTSNKRLLVGHDPPSQVTIVSDGKRLDRKRARTRLPDMNEIPVLQVSSSSMNTEPSTSRTQSLDADHLLFDSDPPTNHKTSKFPNCPSASEPITILEPSSRWLKRLKLSVPHSCGNDTNLSSVEAVLSHRKVNKLFSKVIGGSDTCSFDQSFSYKHDRKDDIVANQSAIVLQKVESSYGDPPKKDVDILLSHSWIKRWCRGATQKKKLEAMVVCEPQSTKMDFGELQNKQFPSIGAMALMGKALKGFQPCEYRKRGSFVVWNTKGT